MDARLPVGRHVVESSGTLMLEDVKPGYEGVYNCRVENLLGSVNASLNVTVQCKFNCLFPKKAENL